jgi:hypothetical protein
MFMSKYVPGQGHGETSHDHRVEIQHLDKKQQKLKISEKRTFLKKKNGYGQYLYFQFIIFNKIREKKLRPTVNRKFWYLS